MKIFNIPDVVMKPSDFGIEDEKGNWMPKPTIARINGFYRHKKTAGTYVVIAIGRNEATLEEVVVYKTPGTMDVHHVWVRPKVEFEDGRFEEIMP